MELDAKTSGNRVDSARKWLSVNKDKLDDPQIAAALVNQFGVTEVVASHLVNMERLRVGEPRRNG